MTTTQLELRGLRNIVQTSLNAEAVAMAIEEAIKEGPEAVEAVMRAVEAVAPAQCQRSVPISPEG